MKVAIRFTDGSKELYQDDPFEPGYTLKQYIQEYKEWFEKKFKKEVSTILVEIHTNPIIEVA